MEGCAEAVIAAEDLQAVGGRVGMADPAVGMDAIVALAASFEL
jgi:hypothetical protein